MNFFKVIFLVLAILSGSFSIAFLIGGISKFQKFDFSDKDKLNFLSLFDALIFNSIFTALFNIHENWDKNREGRIYFYVFGGCCIITFVFGYLAKQI